jgi:hypothetical protein
VRRAAKRKTLFIIEGKLRAVGVGRSSLMVAMTAHRTEPPGPPDLAILRFAGRRQNLLRGYVDAADLDAAVGRLLLRLQEIEGHVSTISQFAVNGNSPTDLLDEP